MSKRGCDIVDFFIHSPHSEKRGSIHDNTLMRCRIHQPFSREYIDRLTAAGYEWHCFQHGQLCFHRVLDAMRHFPRYHLLIKQSDHSFDLSLHYDQLSLEHKSSHKSRWAYTGTRATDEYHRVLDILTSTHKHEVSLPPLEVRLNGKKHRLSKSPSSNGRPWRWDPHVKY